LGEGEVTTQANRKSSKPIDETRWLLSHVRPYLAGALAALGLATGAGLVSTIDPLLMRELIDRALPAHHLAEALGCVGLIASCFVGRALLAGGGGLVGFRVAQSLGQDVRQELLSRMSRLSADWHERVMLGEKLSRLNNDVEQVAQFGADAVNTIVRVSIFFVLNLVIMFRLNVPMTLAVLPLLPIFYLVRRRFRPLVHSRAQETQAGMGRATSRVAEHLDAVPQLHLLGSDELRIADSVGEWQAVVDAQLRQRRTELAFSVSITSILGLAILSVLGIGVYQFIAGALSLGTVVAFYAYTTRIFEPVSSAMEFYARSQRMLASARRVLEVMSTQPSVPDSGRYSQVVSTLQHGVAINGVSFQYSPIQVALNNIQVQVAAGDVVALVGASGSGKSTLARLLVRLADPTHGSVLIDGRPTTEYTLRALRKIVCYVPQTPILFQGSIRENLLYANPVAQSSELDRVLEVAQLSSLLDRFPLGLDHGLGAGAAGLSGGEQQRLAVARALLCNSAVLILDESTSALDVPTEAALLQAIRRFRPNMTTVIISHRLKSLTWVDRFILLDAGAVVGEGDHSTLLRESRLYRTLFDAEPEQPEPNGAGRAATNQDTNGYDPTRAAAVRSAS
jgi:ABC-type multidrug transport system fused ATPase/permease subunit